MPTSLARHDMGLYTMIGRGRKDARGQVLDASMRSTMGRLRTWDLRTQSRTGTATNLIQAFNKLDILNDNLALPDAVVEKTAYIYRKAQKRGLVKGRSINALLAASAYIACREMGAPRTLKDIATACNVKRKELSKDYRMLHSRLDLKVPQLEPMKCIAKVANIAKLGERTKRQAAEIMNNVIQRETLSAGKDPMGLAASVLYLASLNTGENITQANIADAAGVTEVTIRNRVKDLKKQLLQDNNNNNKKIQGYFTN